MVELIDSTQTHWLVFDKERQVVGCHCGFTADNEIDCGWGDCTVKHLMELAWDEGHEVGRHYEAENVESKYHYNTLNNPYADPPREWPDI